MSFHDVEQNTDAWLDLRAGKVTGSSISCIMANYGKAFGNPAKEYAINIANERLRGSRTVGDRYTNKHMEAGHVEEPIARKLYEEKTGLIVANGGFFDNGKTGCSPDGNILFQNKGIEIKSVIPTTHFKTDKKRGFDTKYKWQLLFNMKEAGWDSVDYISFCDQYTQDKRLLIVPVFAVDYKEEFDMIDIRLEQFEKMVEENIKIMKKPW
jgi:hypothetical protein